MVIWYGKKLAGRIDECGGQFAATRFFHVYGVPLLPLDAMWVTESKGKLVRGVPISIPLRSLLAGWLRTGGLIAAIPILAFSDGRLGPLLLGLGLLALVWLSWSWRSVGSRDRASRELFGSVTTWYGDPALLTAEVALGLRRSIEATWAKRSPDLTPKDVAKHGPKEPGQAAAAYCLLLLVAQGADARRGAELRMLAQNIIDAKYVKASGADAGPYRTSAPAKAAAPR